MALPTAPANIPAAPKGLILFGSDNKVYSAKDASGLTELTSSDAPGYAVSMGALGSIPGPADVSGHHMILNEEGCMHYHRHPVWGHVHVEGLGFVHCLHYHPYHTHFAIVLEHEHHHHH